MKVSVFARSGRLRGGQLNLYHGTSSKFLRSIIVNGLDPNQIKERHFDRDYTEKSTLNNPSIESYGGIYFAEDYISAENFARRAAQKIGGNPLIVMVRSHDNLLPDEDSMRYSLKSVLMETQFGNIGELNWTLMLDIWLRFRLNINYSKQNYHFRPMTISDRVEKFFNNLITAWHLNKIDNKARHIYIDISKNLLKAFIERGMAHEFRNLGGDTYRIKRELAYTLFDMLEENDPLFSKYLVITYDDKEPDRIKHIGLKNENDPLFKPLQVVEAEHEFIKWSNKLMIALANKGFMQEEKRINDLRKSDTPNMRSIRTFRTLTPIKFSGRNKIVGIIELILNDYIPSKLSKGKSIYKIYFKLHYGHIFREINDQEVFKWLQPRTTYEIDFKLYDKDNNLIVDNKPIPNSLLE